jgi:hypothetical protein
MKTIKKLITKYGLIILVQCAFSESWFHIVHYFVTAQTYSTHEYLITIPNYTYYVVQLVVCILLIIDSRKYNIKYKITPLIGLFYPVLGVAVFLILYVVQLNNLAEEINNLAEEK